LLTLRARQVLCLNILKNGIFEMETSVSWFKAMYSFAEKLLGFQNRGVVINALCVKRLFAFCTLTKKNSRGLYF
jgi:hypothetical protein